MKIKKGHKILFLLNLLTSLGLLGILIYQIVIGEFGWTNLLVFLVLISNIPQLIESKK